eukprot:tig00000640_g2786.t1
MANPPRWRPPSWGSSKLQGFIPTGAAPEHRAFIPTYRQAPDQEGLKAAVLRGLAFLAIVGPPRPNVDVNAPQ